MGSQGATSSEALLGPWTIGVEIELIAPPGRSRRDLAVALAERAGGEVRTIWHAQTEPSLVPGKPTFHNLTMGFEAVDANGTLVARCVDDLTLQADLDKKVAPLSDWCRVVGDDDRLLRIFSRHIPVQDAVTRSAALKQLCTDLFGAEPLENADSGLVRVVDDHKAPIAILAGLPGERERPCELITPPLPGSALPERLAALLDVAIELGFSAPAEGATHLHFDAQRLTRSQTVVNMVELYLRHRAPLQALLGRNPRWQRTGDWPAALPKAVRKPEFATLPWEEGRKRLEALQLSKYCDINLKNLAYAREDCHTVEMRVIPVLTRTDDIVHVASLFAAFLERARGERVKPRAPLGARDSDVATMLDALEVPAETRAGLRGRATRIAANTASG